MAKTRKNNKPGARLGPIPMPEPHFQPRPRSGNSLGRPTPPNTKTNMPSPPKRPKPLLDERRKPIRPRSGEPGSRNQRPRPPQLAPEPPKRGPVPGSPLMPPKPGTQSPRQLPKPGPVPPNPFPSPPRNKVPPRGKDALSGLTHEYGTKSLLKGYLKFLK